MPTTQQQRRYISRPIALLVAAMLTLSVSGRADSSDLFEKRIRPLLAARCLSCHSGPAARAGLHLDSPTDFSRKMASGKLVIVAGKPEKSDLIAAVSGSGSLQMPPGGKLTAEEIGYLTTWVAQGATWPSATKRISQELWALKPVQKYSLPPVKNSAWPTVPFDRFLLASMEGVGLQPSPPADKRTLCRRLYQDLTGLYPTSAQLNAFLTDPRPDAYERLVDTLLGSRSYGERWARHWMDIARYADSVEDIGPGDTTPSAAFAYRDWLINALNADMPYNQFLTLQIAAGSQGIKADKADLAACGFLTLGRKFGGNPNDVIDDQLDVIMRGTQGLTIGCARCHDHKFDPLSMSDYYALTGVFGSCTSGPEVLQDRDKQTYTNELKRRTDAINQFLEGVEERGRERLVSSAARYMMASTKPENTDPKAAQGYDPIAAARWRQALDAAKGDLDPVFAPWFGYAELKPAEFAAKSEGLARLYRQNSQTRVRLNWQVAMMFAGKPPASLAEVAERYQRLFVDVAAQWKRTRLAARDAGQPEPKGLPVPAQEGVRQIFYGANGPLSSGDAAGAEQNLSLEERSVLDALRRRVAELENSPIAPVRAYVMRDNPAPINAHLLYRGDPARPGEEVPRRFVSVMNSVSPGVFSHGSGRADLAAAIVSPRNPLTARVFVNRVWMYLYGDAIVKTPGDFGSRGELPTNPALLDWLATEFMENGWSIKHLIKTIVTSSAYRMSTAANPDGVRLDPENRLFWRQNRKRLDFEQLRDALLMAGGDIEPSDGGKPFDILARPFVRKRTLYAAVDRDNLPTVFRVFDFASPDASTAERFVTISPQQALFLLNSPFCTEQAVRLANSAGAGAMSTAVNEVTMRLFGRTAGEKEISAAIQYCKGAEPVATPPAESAAESVWSYGWGGLDSSRDRVDAFHRLKTWTGENWAAGVVLPDPELGSMFLSKEGGAPGGDHDHQIIRRFTAPQDCTVTVAGSVKHSGKMGDGIEARIVSSRSGTLGRWKVRSAEIKPEVGAVTLKAGDTLDFMVDCGDNDLEDTFLWAPELSCKDNGKRWSASSQFAGPQEQVKTLTRWQRFVQTLLFTNEFAFVD
jgi:Protein of unknown function (DUF1553)/Protein of unknown function (DUF1549)/Planctomycete cytochrome C